MLQLFLLRHGKAANSTAGQEDYDRPLNQKGIVQINQIGHIHFSGNEQIQKIISSDALRTKQTAQIANYFLGLGDLKLKKELYLAHKNFILSEIQAAKSADSILYVGHNFGISELATHLSGQSISMSTGMLVKMVFETDNWTEISVKNMKHVEMRSPNVYIP